MKIAGLLLTSRAYLLLELEELQALQDNLNRFSQSPAFPLPASDIFSYFLRLAILEKTSTAARHRHASPANLKVFL